MKGMFAVPLMQLLEKGMADQYEANWRPLNEAAARAHQAHVARVDPLWDAWQAAKEAAEKAERAMQDEQQRWHDEMVAAMPELPDSFRVSENGLAYKRKVDVPHHEGPRPPDWVAEMLAGENGGS